MKGDRPPYLLFEVSLDRPISVGCLVMQASGMIRSFLLVHVVVAQDRLGRIFEKIRWPSVHPPIQGRQLITHIFS